MLLLLHEEELMEEDFLVFLIEFITGGSISHLFQYEEYISLLQYLFTPLMLYFRERRCYYCFMKKS